MIVLAAKEYCTGCGACSAVCLVHAISICQSEEDGFYRPLIAQELCIKCGQCISVCPAIDRLSEKNFYYGKVYAAINRNQKVRNVSASGGIFAAFATEVIKRGGCAAGVLYDENWNIVHRLAIDEKELIPLLGSKYAQSDMRFIYGEIHEKLTKGKQVLFCGTPCQVMGIKRFAQEKGIEKRLMTIDLLCRGIPSLKAFHKYLEMIEKQYKKKIVRVQFKDNEKGWHNVNTRIVMEDGSQCYLPIGECTYVKGFLEHDMTVQDACFHCAYKTTDRVGDITIGDFWGLNHTRLVDDKGTSIVMINSKKGAALWEDVKLSLEYQESTMWRVVKGNRMAFQKLPENPVREQFWKYLKEYDYDKALEMAGEMLKE